MDVTSLSISLCFIEVTQLIESGLNLTQGVFPFTANGRVRAMGDMTGMVKILSDAKDETILGVHIMGSNAAGLIAEVVLLVD